LLLAPVICRHSRCMTTFIQFALALGGDVPAREVPATDIARLIKSPDPVWIHLQSKNAKARAWIDQNLHDLDIPTLNALMAEETRPRFSEIGTGALISLRGVNYNQGADPEDMVSIHLWVDAHRIVSVATQGMKSVDDIRARILAGDGPTGTGAFICALINGLNLRIERFHRMLDNATDTLEQLVIEAPDQDQRRPIMERRLEAIVFRRYITPQRDEVSHLMVSTLDWLRPEDKRHLHEGHNTLIRVVEDLDAIRERLQILKDELSSIMGDRLSKNMYILSLLTALFLPLGFLTGLFGINVGGIPGAHITVAFWIFVAVMAAIIILQALLFRLIRWF